MNLTAGTGAASWRKSTYSGGNGGNCIEAGSWRKSAYSIGNGDCVEAGQGSAAVGVRDTKLGDASPVLAFSPDAWRRFIARAAAGK